MPLPLHKDTSVKRYVGYPTTAASLNLAAIGACVRTYLERYRQYHSYVWIQRPKRGTEALNIKISMLTDNFTGSGPYDDIGIE
ncbi:hypothetical protein O9929_26465 [Vibrio lentus]|nr:hypothetical protein [Vibrio lentus]